MMKRLIAAALLACAGVSLAHAQSSPNFSYGQVPTAGQWNAAFASKQDVLTFTPLNVAGGTMLGKLYTAASTVNGSGFSIQPGVAPNSASNGDIWLTSAGLFARINGQNTQFLSSANLNGYAPLNSPAFTGSATFASGSAQYPTALSILPSTNATSRRSALSFGDWAIIQDSSGNGTKDFGVYSGPLGYFPLNISTAGIVAFSASPTAPTPPAGDNSSKLAPTAYVDRAVSQAGGVTTASMPQGRLTLVSGSPVMASAVSAATSVIYTPDRGNLVPLWSGSTFVMTAFTERTLSTSGLAASSVYDVCMWNNSGTATATFSPAWSAGTGGSNTTRGTGTGSAALTRVNGFLVNANAFSGGPAAGYCTYVGTVATDATGATVSWNPGGISTGGTAAVFNVWNAYNRRPVMALVGDTTSSWSYSSTTMRPANGSTTMRATFVIGAPEEPVEASYRTYSTGGYLGVGLDSTSAYSGVTGITSGNSLLDGFYRGTALGAHYVQALEWTGGGSATYSGQYYSALRFTASF